MNIDRFIYDASAKGLLVVEARQHRGIIGTKPGYLRPDKRRTITVNYVHYFEHELVWYMHKGYFAKQLDHIDRDPTNNTIENLREVTTQQNCYNRHLQVNNTSGYKGVSFRKDLKKKPWVAGIKVDGRRLSLGYYETAEEAARAYDQKAKELFKEYGWLNFG